MSKALSLKGAIQSGWDTTAAYWKTLIPATLGFLAISLLASYFLDDQNGFGWFSGANNYLDIIIGTILQTVVSAVVTVGIVRVSLNCLDKKPQNGLKGITPELVLNAIFASIIINLLITIGIVALIIPGIYFALRYSQTVTYMVDHKSGVLDSLKNAGDITRGHLWEILGFYFLCAGVLLLGVIALGVGLVVALPVVFVASAHLYRQMLKLTA